MRPGESFVMQPVRSLQTMLRVIAEDDNTLPTVVPDGIYGPSTMQAVSAFQRKYSLPVTGAVNQVVLLTVQLSFQKIYDCFLSKITDDMYIELTPSDTRRDCQNL